MALFPDPASAALYALATFLLVLGVLVVFVEAMRPSRFLSALMAALGVAVLLVLAGESGVALVAAAVGAALVANKLFEWLTSR